MMKKAIIPLIFFLFLCGCLTPIAEKNVLKNPGFEEMLGGQAAYWRFFTSKDGAFVDTNSSHSGKASACIVNMNDGNLEPNIISQSLTYKEGVKHAELSGFIKTEDVGAGGRVAICIQCWDDKKMIGFYTTPQDNRFEGNHEWTEVFVDLVVPEGTEKIVVMALLAGTGKAWFDDIKLLAMEGTSAALIKAYGSYIVSQTNTGEGWISFSPPINYESQALLGFWMESEPPGYIKEYRFERDKEPNYVVHVDLNQIPAGKNAKVDWYAYVFTKALDYSALPEDAPISDLDDVPEDVKIWLEPTPGVQSDHSEIVAKAEELMENSSNIIEVAEKITTFVSREIKERVGMQDALTTLRTGGALCTGRANLAAALFRASGIPCRVVAVSSMPQLQTHYIVEFYVPHYGWVRMESTLGFMPYQDNGCVILRIVYPEDETQTPYGVPLYTTVDNASNIYLKYGLKNYCYQGREVLKGYYGSEKEVATAYAKTTEIGKSFINGENKNAQSLRGIEDCETIEEYIRFLGLHAGRN